MAILIVADQEDLHADCIVSKAREHGHEVVRVSPAHDYGEAFSFNSSNTTSVEVGGKSLTTSEISGVFGRVAIERLSECFSPRNAIERYSIEEESVAWLTALLLLPETIWMNSPRYELWADVKPLSLKKASRIGLRVPDFLITNSVSKVHSFCQNRTVVIKTLSDASFARQNSIYLSVPELGEFDVPGTRIFRPEEVDWGRFDGTPFLLQNYIRRTEEYRVTVIDSTAFTALAVVPSERIDIKEYKFPCYTASNIPKREELLLVELSKALGLRICTFDILRSQEGELFLVDINPGGNWLWLDQEFHGEISDKIVNSLS